MSEDPQPATWSRRVFLSSGAATLAAILAGCEGDDASGSASPSSSSATGTPTGERVVVVGAGPAGMSAAHLLRQRGVDTLVLEAGPTHGGRIRHDLEFADFPIPLGAEWVHVNGAILDEIVNDPDVAVTTELVPYTDDDQVAFVAGGVTMLPLKPGIFDVDTKFVGSSWLDFFETYVVPGIADIIEYGAQVVEIDHGGESATLVTADGAVHEADRVIVTVPLRILQQRDVTFTPALEDDRVEIIESATVWSGLKAFFEFEEAFYPAAIAFPDSDTDEGQRLFYDAAYGQDTDQNIMGVFSVGAPAERYQAMSDDELSADVLGELDAAFDGAASRSYVRHLVQNWNDEPFAGAAYLADDASSAITRRLAEPLGERVLFAGSAYTSFDDWSSVHTAARSAADAVERILG